MGQRLSHMWCGGGDTAGIVLDGTIKGLEATKDFITAAAPVPGLSIALNVTIELLKKIQEAQANNEGMNELCEEATTLGSALEKLARTVQDGLDKYAVGSPERQTQEQLFESSQLPQRLERLQRDLRIICDDVDRLGRRTGLGKFMHSGSDAKAVADMKGRIATACQNFQLEGDIRTEAIVTETLSNIKRVLSDQQTLIAAQKLAEEELVLNNIPRADDAPYLSAANAAKARFQTGTRRDVFQDLDKWKEAQLKSVRDHPQSQPVCVLVGEAGTGKSTIASEFAKRLDNEEPSRLGASFFFNRGVSDLNSPKKLFSTIASQLARSQPALRTPIVAAARKHHRVAPLQQLKHEYHDLLEAPLSTLPSSHPPIFVVIDALDECIEEGPDLVPTLLRLLLSYAVQPGCPLRIFITSRPEPHYIHRVFTLTHLQPHISTLHIQSFRDSIDHDIELLLRARLDEDERSKRWSEENPAVVQGLVDRADGLFIYARTAIDFILSDLCSLQQRYDALLPVDAKAFGLKRLDELYRTVLHGEFPPEEQYPQRKKDLRAVLGYLVTIQESKDISPRTLELLTNLPIKRSVPILNALRSVVFFERDNHHSPFRILHATFREFLVDRTRSGDDFHVDAQQCHRQLAKNCAQALQRFKDPMTRYHCPSALLGPYNYARAHFLYHYEQSGMAADERQSRDVKSALTYVEQLPLAGGAEERRATGQL